MFSATSCSLSARAGMAVAFVGIGLVLAVLPSCARPQQPPRLVEPGQPVAHAVYADDLRAAMRDLNRAASEQIHMQLYTGSGPVVDMRQVSQSADLMAQTATRLPQFVADVQMEPVERQIYNNLAQRLHDQSVILKQQADRNELTAAQSTMNQVINTCNTCHTMFRSVAGPID